MTDFAQALAWIEAAIADQDSMTEESVLEVTNLLLTYTDSIVQLGKVAQEMRELLPLLDDPRDYRDTVKSYDKLMTGDEG